MAGTIADGFGVNSPCFVSVQLIIAKIRVPIIGILVPFTVPYCLTHKDESLNEFQMTNNSF